MLHRQMPPNIQLNWKKKMLQSKTEGVVWREWAELQEWKWIAVHHI